VLGGFELAAMVTDVDVGAEGALKLGEGEVRKPALAIEVRCDSGLGLCLRYKTWSEVSAGRDVVTAGSGFDEMATGLPLVCICPAMKAPDVVPGKCR
jgi:hypothetical protein